jgi:hypothetical protein
LAWAPSSLPLKFVRPTKFYCPLSNIKILGVRCGSISFTHFFLQEALGEDVWHVDVFLKLKDIHVAFGIFFSMFRPEAFFFVLVFPPFRNQLVIFYSTLMGIFLKLLGLGSLKSPKAPFVHRQMALTIFNGGIRLISSNVIALATYLES